MADKDLYIDVRDFKHTLDILLSVLGPVKLNTLVHDTLVDVGKKTATIIKKETVKDYAVTQSWVGKQIGRPILGSPAKLQCVIPIKGARGSIGGTFPLKTKVSGRPGKRRRKKAIRAKILTRAQSRLPETMEHQGGQPPFVAKGKNTNKKIVFTRKYKDKARPIVRVVGVAPAQMPLNRSEDKIRAEINKYLLDRIEHHYDRLMSQAMAKGK